METKPCAPSGTLGNPVAVDDDGLLVDVDVQSIDDNEAPRTTREDKRQDVDHFFLAAEFKDMKGKSKKYRLCKVCPYVIAIIMPCFFSLLTPLLCMARDRNNKSLVNEVTTLRRHLEANHAVRDMICNVCALTNVLTYSWLGKVSPVGEEGQFFIQTTWGRQEAQRGHGRGDANS
jgi:hypothetical protein